MKKSKAIKAIEKAALAHGVSTAEARADMQSALNHAYDTNPDDTFWAKWGGKKPTLEQFILAVSDDVLARLGRKS